MIADKRIAMYKIPPLKSTPIDTNVFGLRYLEWNDHWCIWWERHASGSFFWWDRTNDTLICLKHLLNRSPEIVTHYLYDMGIRTQDMKNAGNMSQLGNEILLVQKEPWKASGGYLTSKINGLLIGLTTVP
eukprot:UN31120